MTRRIQLGRRNEDTLEKFKADVGDDEGEESPLPKFR